MSNWVGNSVRPPNVTPRGSGGWNKRNIKDSTHRSEMLLPLSACLCLSDWQNSNYNVCTSSRQFNLTMQSKIALQQKYSTFPFSQFSVGMGWQPYISDRHWRELASASAAAAAALSSFLFVVPSFNDREGEDCSQCMHDLLGWLGLLGWTVLADYD